MTKRKAKSDDGDELNGYEFEGEQVHAVHGKISGSIPLDRLIHDGDRTVVVLDVTAGPPTFKRSSGLLVREHKLAVARGSETTGTDIAEDVESFLAALREREAKAAEEAKQLEGQQSIDDELLAQEAEKLLRDALKGVAKAQLVTIVEAIDGLDPASTAMLLREQIVEHVKSGALSYVQLFDEHGNVRPPFDGS